MSFLIRKKEPSAEFKKNKWAAGWTPDQLQPHYFGSLVWSVGAEVKRTINNKYNSLWIAPHRLPSGQTYLGLLDSIRDRFWQAEMVRRAQANAYTYRARQKKELEALTQGKGAGSSKRARLDPKDVAEAIVNFKEKSWQEFYDEDIKRLRANPDHTMYPQEWLPFLLAGYPAGYFVLWER